MPVSGFVPSDVHAQRFTVEHEYPVVFVRGAFREGARELEWAVTRGATERQRPVFVVLDGGLLAARPALAADVETAVRSTETLELRGSPFVLPGGEAAKNDPALVTALLARFAEAKLDRHATVVAIGGGAVLDAAGYAAAT